MGAQDWNSIPPKVLGLTTAAAIAIDANAATVFKVGPGSDITFTITPPGKVSEERTIIIDTIDTNTRTLTFSTGFRATGTLATGATAARRFILKFESDGLVWSEVSRTAAMA